MLTGPYVGAGTSVPLGAAAGACKGCRGGCLCAHDWGLPGESFAAPPQRLVSKLGDRGR